MNMLTLHFDEKCGRPKYEQLYRHVRECIVRGVLRKGDRLPSKRKLAAHLHISMNTIENAYAQLAAEGYVESEEKRGYFVLPVAPRAPDSARVRDKAKSVVRMREKADSVHRFDMRNNTVDTDSFPFATWSRLMRDSLRGDHAALLRESDSQGDMQLREAIAGYLEEYRNMRVSPEQILLGAGTAYLLGILVELLPGVRFALENPGYYMIARTLHSRGVPFDAIPVDDEGFSLKALAKSRSSICFLTPSNQFPLSTVMSIDRRMRLLDWTREKTGRYLIEDDYDSDYRYSLKPAPALHSLGGEDRVIYLNTFARTLTPSLRIAYLVLPKTLLDAYLSRRRFYSCTVSGFEQRTLWRFIEGGHYERHLSRMRTLYKKRRNVLLKGLSPLAGRMTVSGTESGLHLLLRSSRGRTEAELMRRAAANGVKVYGLSDFYHGTVGETNTVIAGYGGLDERELEAASSSLCKAWKR